MQKKPNDFGLKYCNQKNITKRMTRIDDQRKDYIDPKRTQEKEPLQTTIDP